MKICFLGAASSIHTVRWVNAMAELGHDVSLITMHPTNKDKIDSCVKIFSLKYTNKLGYYLNILEVKKIIHKVSPDILNVHYASGYGTLARLAKFSPTLLSVFGSDVYLYPYQSKLNEITLRKNLKAADQIASTSKAMKDQTELFVNPNFPIVVTPFGIDLERFSPGANTESNNIVIGTVKTLEEKYGIDILIKVVALLLNKLKEEGYPDISDKIKLRIVGSGSELINLKKLAEELEIANMIEFVGAVPNEEVPNYLRQFDIYCAFSRSESFGVAVIEASACEIPVVVSNVGGLPEVVQQGETGFIIDNNNEDEIIDKLYQLVIDKEIRKDMGKKGRKFVSENFDWEDNVLHMEKIYKDLVQKNNRL